jgi:hypothetical protein
MKRLRHSIVPRGGHIACALATGAFVLLSCLPAKSEEKEKTPAGWIIEKAKEVVLGRLEDVAKDLIEESGVMELRKEHAASASFVGDKEAHVGVGDVYELELKLDFTRRGREFDCEEKGPCPVSDDYKYTVYVNGEAVLTDTILRYKYEMSNLKGGDRVGVTRTHEVHHTKTIYLMATSLGSSDCKAQSTKSIRVRAFIETTVRYPAKRDAIGNKISARREESLLVENFKEPQVKDTQESDQIFGTAQKAVIIHNPWSVSLDTYPEGTINHNDPSGDRVLKFRLLERRSFSKFNIGNPPPNGILRTWVFNDTATEHFDFVGSRREPPRDALLAFADNAAAAFAQPYKFTGKQGHHSPAGDRELRLRFKAELSGKRQLKEGTGDNVAWQVEPKITAHDDEVCGEYVIKVVDKDAPEKSSEKPPAPAPANNEYAVCGVILPKGIGPNDVVSGSHLPQKSFNFESGTKGDADYLRGILKVSPGIRCDNGLIGFPVFGGVSIVKDYFIAEIAEGDTSASRYWEQWLKGVRVTFDNGKTLSATDALLIGRPPDGAKRVTRIEMDFNGGEKAKATLTWTGE